MLLSGTAGSSSGNKSAIAGHLNGMTKRAYATFVIL